MAYSARRRTFYQRFAKVHGALLVRTKGRPRRLGLHQYACVLETVGRTSGRTRQLPLLYLPHGDAFLVLASNYGQERAPAWWFNLQARPDAFVLTQGRRVPVRARVLEGEERAAMVPIARDYNKQWREYLTSVERTIPFVLLERQPGPEAVTP
jgi:deazaflavin-dependent oxidoreductase (nitroreductase family)